MRFFFPIAHLYPLGYRWNQTDHNLRFQRPLQEPGMIYREASHQVVCINELPFFHKIKARIHHPHPHGRVEFLYTELIDFRLFTVLRNSFSQPFWRNPPTRVWMICVTVIWKKSRFLSPVSHPSTKASTKSPKKKRKQKIRNQPTPLPCHVNLRAFAMPPTKSPRKSPTTLFRDSSWQGLTTVTHLLQPVTM